MSLESEPNSRANECTRALQSERIHVLVGEQQERYQVSRDLLARCSPVFNVMCTSSFKESVEGIIRLPEVQPATFEDFMIWLHSYLPSQSIVKDVHAIIDFAIFSDIFQITPLQNQSSDIIYEHMTNDEVPITPEIISKIYTSTPDASVLRKLFCLCFCKLHRPGMYYSSDEDLSEWEKLFDHLSNFGRDYFRYTRKSSESLSRTRACYFHDHSNMLNWVPDDARSEFIICPYPEGGDWIENEIEMEKLRELERQKEAKQEAKKKKKEVSITVSYRRSTRRRSTC